MVSEPLSSHGCTLLGIFGSWWSKKLKKQPLLLKIIFLPCLTTIAYRVFRPKYVWMWDVCIAGLKKNEMYWLFMLAFSILDTVSGNLMTALDDCRRQLLKQSANMIIMSQFSGLCYFKLRCFTSKSIQKTLEKESEVSNIDSYSIVTYLMFQLFMFAYILVCSCC